MARVWRVIVVSGKVSACSRNWQNQIQNSLGWDLQSRCMSATSRGNFGRNQEEGFAITQKIYLDAVFTRFIWYVLLETTPSSESVERFINCVTSSWSVVCFTSYYKFVYMFRIGANLSSALRRALVVESSKPKQYRRNKKRFWLIAAMQIDLPSFAQMLAILFLELFVAPKNSRIPMTARISVTLLLYRNPGLLV